MASNLLFAVVIFGSAVAENVMKVYIPILHMESESDVEDGYKNHCVTKGYIDKLFLNLSQLLDGKKWNVTDIVEKMDLTELETKLANDISTSILEQFDENRICEKNGHCQSNCTHEFENELAEINGKLNHMSAMIMEHLKVKPKDCEDIENETTGIYNIYPNDRARGISVRCDMDTSNGGWTVIQRRISDSDFYKTWDEYETGFGNLSGNFWLGLRYIHLISSQEKYELRVDLTSMDGETAYAKYNTFSVDDAESDYKFVASGYSGSAGDALTVFSGMKFSTYDKDNDAKVTGNCAVQYHGAWWYKSCHYANLNGDYGNTALAIGPVWGPWKGYSSPLKTTEMKIRRI